MNSSVMLVILVPKKDGTWTMCIDCRLINNIIVPHPCLNDLLDELYGSQIFCIVNLRSGYH
ncbi:hypothetical protein CR513_59723, partial [Mucuna pruriens]